MKEHICNMVEKAITKHKVLSKSLEVDNAGYYIWVYNKGIDKRVMVVHGHGDEYSPLEIILIDADKGVTVKKHFEDENDMVRYIKKDLLKELIIYAL